MGLFSSTNPKEQKHTGVVGSFSVDLIKWEPEDDVAASMIAHKFEYEDFPTGSYLIVGPSQIAIFTNNMSTGTSLDESAGQTQVSIFVGPCKIKLETGDARFAPFRNLAHKFTSGESAFHSTVYFINTTYMNELKWGTQQPILLQDPEEEVNVHVRANGLFGVHLEQVDTSIAATWARIFLQKVVGTRANFSRAEFVSFMRAKILEYVPNLLAAEMIDKCIGILRISTHLSEFSDAVFEQLKPYFEEFGLVLDNFSFHSINVPEEDLAAINEMKIQRKRDQLSAEGAAKKMDIESAARARMREREGYTYQQEQGFNVMQSAAQNEGMSSTFMGAGMGLGMGAMVGTGMGSAIGSIAENTLQSTDMATPGAVRASSCPTCQAPVEPAAKFCMSCGAKLAQEKPKATCPNCSHEVSVGAKFCSNCGSSLATTCANCGHALEPAAKFCMECGQTC